MNREPDWNKLADISKRLEAASKKPGYSGDVFDHFADEARQACGDYPQYTEFLARFEPARAKSPAKNSLAASSSKRPQ